MPSHSHAMNEPAAPSPPATREWLEERRAAYRHARDAAAQREANWSWARLACFLLGFVALLLVKTWPLVCVPTIAAAIGLFVLAVRRHLRAMAEREAGDRLVLVTDEALARSGGAVVCVRDWRYPDDPPGGRPALDTVLDPGPTWPLTEQERDDLDLFAAPVGVFGLLNRTSSTIGARRLRSVLCTPCLAASDIAARQAMVRWLRDSGEARLQLMGGLAALRDEDRRLPGLIDAIRDTASIEPPLAPTTLKIWSAVSTLLTLLVVGQLAVGNYWWAALGLIVWGSNFVVQFGTRKQVAACKQLWQSAGWPTRAYRIAAAQAADRLPGDTQLARIRAACGVVAPDLLGELRQRVAWADPAGGLWGAVNLVTLADLLITTSITRRVTPRRDDLLRGLGALADLDALCSLAAFAAEQPHTCFPAVCQETRLAIRQGRHPLIAPGEVVPNDVELSSAARLWVITGSNMAGKSTFLRMAGVNVLLAQVGCAVSAEAMTWSPLRLISDLRTRDNLAGGESYFLAEVRHLKRMIAPANGPAPILGLIDEPFRGTNSRDQSAASVAVVRQLLRGGGLYLLATHDPHLTEIVDGQTARNFHFRENLDSAALTFDYHIHAGPAQTRNALRILEIEGYPADLVGDAHAWLGE